MAESIAAQNMKENDDCDCDLCKLATGTYRIIEAGKFGGGPPKKVPAPEEYTNAADEFSRPLDKINRFKFLHINIRGIRKKADFLKTILKKPKDSKNRILALGLTETKLTAKETKETLENLKVPGYTKLHNDSLNFQSRGQLVYIRDDFDVDVHINLKSPGDLVDCSVVKISKPGTEYQFIFVVIYAHDKAHKSEERRNEVLYLLKNVNAVIKPFRCRTIIMGDFNVNLLDKYDKANEYPGKLINQMFDDGFDQKIEDQTHNRGSLLDHVYLNRDFETDGFESFQVKCGRVQLNDIISDHHATYVAYYKPYLTDI